MMTRKHFVALAGALRMLRAIALTPQAVNVWQMAVTSIADVCQQSNPQFNRSKFLSACGDERA